MTERIMNALNLYIPIGDYRNYVNQIAYDDHDKKWDVTRRPYELILLGPRNKKDRSPNTLLLSIVKHKGSSFCNQTLKKSLFNHNIIVSIGSACNTGDTNASHVINAINAPDMIKKGIVRISLHDGNTKEDIDKFISIFLKCIGKQIPGVNRPRQKNTCRS